MDHWDSSIDEKALRRVLGRFLPKCLKCGTVRVGTLYGEVKIGCKGRRWK